jgi:osmotically-inducible protein OsmY
MTLTRAFNMMLIVVLFGAILMMYACSNNDGNGETVGQKVGKKVDAAIDATNTTVNDASSKIADSATKADAALKDTGEKIGQRAGDAADRAGKVAAVVDDALITTSIKADLLKDPGLSAFRVDVNTVQGEVTLKGDVDTEAAKQRAGRLALAIAGVTRVNNLLAVSTRHAQAATLRNAVDREETFLLTPARMRKMT